MSTVTALLGSVDKTRSVSCAHAARELSTDHSLQLLKVTKCRTHLASNSCDTNRDTTKFESTWAESMRESDLVRAVERADAIDALRNYHFEVQAFRDTVAHHFGVTVREGQAVAHLVAHGELSVSELGRLIGVAPATTTHLLGRLDRAGLATATADPTDLRRTILRPTERAISMIDQIRGWLGVCLDGVVESDLPLDVLVQTLTALRNQLHGARMALPALD